MSNPIHLTIAATDMETGETKPYNFAHPDKALIWLEKYLVKLANEVEDLPPWGAGCPDEYSKTWAEMVSLLEAFAHALGVEGGEPCTQH